MKTKGINKDLDNYKFEFGTQEYKEIKLKSMIISCFCYGSIERDSDNYNRYIKETGKDLSPKVFEQVYKEQSKFLKEKSKVVPNVYTDFEGSTYNSIEYSD